MQHTPQNNSHKLSLATALCAGFLAVAMPGGCAQEKSSQTFDIVLPPSGERLAKAINLTAQGEEAQDAGDAEVAMALYKEATTLSADAPSAAWNNLGMLHMERSEYVQATKYLNMASLLAPLDPQPMYNLGVAYHKAGWDRKALESFVKSLDREPNYINAIRGAATSTMRLRLTDEDALDRLKHALLVETDSQWRDVFERERLQMEARLKIQDR